MECNHVIDNVLIRHHLSSLGILASNQRIEQVVLVRWLSTTPIKHILRNALHSLNIDLAVSRRCLHRHICDRRPTAPPPGFHQNLVHRLDKGVQLVPIEGVKARIHRAQSDRVKRQLGKVVRKRDGLIVTQTAPFQH